jgi:hypothetical protein
MPTPVRKKRADAADKSGLWWLRKKVPMRLRPIVGRAEVWRSLGTTDRRAATVKCVTLSAELEAEWARLAKAVRAGGSHLVASIAPPDPVSQKDLHALSGVAHARTRDAHVENPGTGFAEMRWAALASQADEEQTAEDAEFVDLSIQAFLEAENVTLDDARMRMFRPLYIEARRRGYADLIRASKGDFSPSPVYYPERSGPKLDIIAAFETYSEKGGLKGRKFGPTAKRWRPKVAMFVKWLGHRDLSRMTTDDGYSWMDHLTEQGFAKKSIRDVWIASLSATAGFMVERRKLAQNPFRGIKVRDVKEGRPDDEKGFTGEQAKIILTATLAGRSHLISRETYAARRWAPWLCAYSGARVSEITSLWPADVVKLDGIWCVIIQPELEKTEKHRKRFRSTSTCSSKASWTTSRNDDARTVPCSMTRRERAEASQEIRNGKRWAKDSPSGYTP